MKLVGLSVVLQTLWLPLITGGVTLLTKTVKKLEFAEQLTELMLAVITRR
jgi:hypothetical protein